MEKKLFNDLGNYLIERFGQKVWKVPVDAGFTCPNRDGVKGVGGCIYCNNDAFSQVDEVEIAVQVSGRIETLKKKNIHAYIVYFQSYSNTYGSIDEIKRKIESALVDDGIVSIHIGTRPDTIDAEKLDYLAELNKKYEVVIEYGLQSARPESLEYLNRGHTVEDFVKAVEMTHERGLKVCAHIIFGLPDETKEDMLNSVKLVASLGVHSVKFHHLHVVKNTELENKYLQGKIKLLTDYQYAEILAYCIPHLPSQTVISRLVGDATEEIFVAPKWDLAKSGVINLALKIMKSKQLHQGDLFGK